MLETCYFEKKPVFNALTGGYIILFQITTIT